MIPRGYLAPTCEECGRTFDLLNAEDAAEWECGHDCEPPPCDTPADVLRRYGIATATDAHGTRIAGMRHVAPNDAA